MKVVIFAGGFGTRLSEETVMKPKPMVEIGEHPILWHIMKIYDSYGYDDFIVCCGYKGWMIKQYFLNYYKYESDITVDLKDNEVKVHRPARENFKVTLVDTGLNTMTAGRLKQVLPYTDGKPFMLTYGDGVADVDVSKLIEFHESKGKICTMTAVQAGSRFGVLDIAENGDLNGFQEKPKDSGSWINGGFFVLQPEVKDYLPEVADDIMWEQEPLANLAANNQMAAYKHTGFWKCMDTLRDKNQLNELWDDQAPWKKW